MRSLTKGDAKLWRASVAEGGAENTVRKWIANANVRTQITRIVEHAGVTPWPKLFQNLQATRATVLDEKFPGHVATAWMGHGVQVAKDHYWK